MLPARSTDDNVELDVSPKLEIFSATLTPYRSLPPSGFLILMLLFGGTCFVAGFFYLIIGAWPVFAFFGLDVLILFIAFRLNYRQARAYEEIIVRRDLILIQRVNPKGKATELRFNPFWVRLQLTKDDEDIVREISLSAKGERTQIGGFLNPDDKTSFAKAFGAALSEARA